MSKRGEVRRREVSGGEKGIGGNKGTKRKGNEEMVKEQSRGETTKERRG